MALILAVDDEVPILAVVRSVLEPVGHVVFGARDGEQCEELLRVSTPDIIIMDIYMPKQSGLQTIEKIRRSGRPHRILAISGGNGRGPEGLLRVAKELGADATLKKPFGVQDLLAAVSSLLPVSLCTRDTGRPS